MHITAEIFSFGRRDAVEPLRASNALASAGVIIADDDDDDDDDDSVIQ